MPRLALIVLAVTAFACIVPIAAAADAPLTFEKDVRPILKAHCFHCHGEEEEKKGGLDLRLVRLMAKGGESGAAISPGNASGKHLLLERIGADEMPPGEKKLSDSEKETIARWIATGARTAKPEPAMIVEFTDEERGFWAFQPVRRPAVPSPRNGDRVRTPIDAFILEKLEAQGLSFSPEADRATLIRRAHFDLLGLPPAPEAVDCFVNDSAPDAYERLIDDLLKSPRYGERWGRHWLDVAGYADSDGYGNKDIERPHAYRYRDYVIRSFNDDKPFDLFIQEQLAGDELSAANYGKFLPEDADRLIATGFLRMGPDGTGDPESDQILARHDVLAETVKIVSTSLLGLSVGCAQCHNHRFDPISHVDYHRLRAIFEPAYNTAAWKNPEERTVSLLTPSERAALEVVEGKLAEAARSRAADIHDKLVPLLEARLADLPAAERESAGAAARRVLALPADTAPDAGDAAVLKKYPRLKVSESDVRRADPKRYAEELKAYEARVTEIKASGPPQLIVAALTENPGAPPKSHLFHRGDFRQPAQEVVPGDLTVLLSEMEEALPIDDPALPTSGRRLAYARHLTDGGHPLTSRVLVNRFWMLHFGRGIVATAADFGAQGERPTHPDLLDWLADEFSSTGWRLKALHKQIMLSSVYRQSSLRTDELDRLDPENRWLARANVRRLEAEPIRDAMLAVSGLFNPKMYGPPLPVAPNGVGQIVIGTPAASRDGRVIKLKDREEYRRSLYVQARRTLPLGMLETFDAPAMTPNCESRVFSTVAPQALMLMNNDDVLALSQGFAERVAREAGTDGRDRVDRAWRLAFGAPPTRAQTDRALRFLREQRDHLSREAGQDAGMLALTSFCQLLFNSNAFLYVD